MTSNNPPNAAPIENLDSQLDNLIRDITAIGFHASKSEWRDRIAALLLKTRITELNYLIANADTPHFTDNTVTQPQYACSEIMIERRIAALRQTEGNDLVALDFAYKQDPTYPQEDALRKEQK